MEADESPNQAPANTSKGQRTLLESRFELQELTEHSKLTILGYEISGIDARRRYDNCLMLPALTPSLPDSSLAGDNQNRSDAKHVKVGNYHKTLRFLLHLAKTRSLV